MAHKASASVTTVVFFPADLPFLPVYSTCVPILTMSAVTLGSLSNSATATMSIAAKNKLNSSGARLHPCRRPWPTSNHSEYCPSSIRTCALMPSWKWRMTASIFGGTPKRRSTSHSRSRPTESYALVRSTKHANTAVLFFLASSWSRWMANSMSSVDRCGRKPLCSSGRMPSRSQ
ncbi:unnamed protein product [Ectocarpus sp. CCAP 1310/34]|nr:unnamed protein product [Ectocarpus sp. CCAP 1310/34]